MLQVSTDVRRSECVCCACGVCCAVLCCAVTSTTNEACRVQVAGKNVIKSPHLTSPPSHSLFKTRHKNVIPHSIIIIIIHFEQN